MATTSVKTVCCVAGGRPAGTYARLPACVRRRSSYDCREARGFLSRLPRRHGTPIDARNSAPTPPSGAADVRLVPARYKFIALMPQRDSSIFCPGARRSLQISICAWNTKPLTVMNDWDRITRVVARGPAGDTVHIVADVVVGCDHAPSGRIRTARVWRTDGCALVPDQHGVPVIPNRYSARLVLGRR